MVDGPLLVCAALQNNVAGMRHRHYYLLTIPYYGALNIACGGGFSTYSTIYLFNTLSVWTINIFELSKATSYCLQ